MSRARFQEGTLIILGKGPRARYCVQFRVYDADGKSKQKKRSIGLVSELTKRKAMEAQRGIVMRETSQLPGAPLLEEIKVILKVSQNLHAHSLPLVLGATVGHATTKIEQAGFDLEHRFLSEAGLDLSGAAQADGEGGNALFTPEFLVHYLAYMATQKEFAGFRSALPILGRDGTLWEIQTTSPAAGHVFAKTGTDGVSNLLNHNLILTAKEVAGYTTTASGEHLAFALYDKNVPLSNDPEDVTKYPGQALGELAAGIYLLPIAPSIAGAN